MMRSLAAGIVALLLAVHAGAHAAAQPLALPAAPTAAIEQRIGARLPLDMKLVDDLGGAVRLGDYFDGERPVLLVLGYYQCPQLCGLLMHGLLEGLQESALPRRQWRIVGVSIDPQDTPASARARRELDFAYADFLLGSRKADAPLDLHLLVAAPRDIQRLARRVGFDYSTTATSDHAALDAGARFAHPAAVMVVTPRGEVSRYLMGIDFAPADLRSALAQARAGAVGALTHRIALLCAHFDPAVGRHSGAVMNGIRLLGLAGVAWFVVWAWRRRGPGTGASS
jgi:protein SCO1